MSEAATTRRGVGSATALARANVALVKTVEIGGSDFVTAARALGAEIVIAANLSSDIFAHSTTIYSHGASEVAKEVPVAPARRGIGKFFSAERAVKREFFGGGGRPGISSVMVDAFNIMQDRITRARLAQHQRRAFVIVHDHKADADDQQGYRKEDEEEVSHPLEL